MIGSTSAGLDVAPCSSTTSGTGPAGNRSGTNITGSSGSSASGSSWSADCASSDLLPTVRRSPGTGGAGLPGGGVDDKRPERHRAISVSENGAAPESTGGSVIGSTAASSEHHAGQCGIRFSFDVHVAMVGPRESYAVG